MNRLPFPALLPLLALISPLSAGPPGFEIAPGIHVDPSGGMQVGEVSFAIQHFGPEARCSAQSAGTVTGTPALNAGVWELQGQMAIAGGEPVSLCQTLTRQPGHAVSYRAVLRGAPPFRTQQLALGIHLPIDLLTGVSLTLDETRFELPASVFSQTLRWRGVRRLTCPLPQGKLVMEGPADVQLQDGRNFADKRHFRLRLLFHPEKGDLAESSLAMTLRLEPYAAQEQRPAFAAAQRAVLTVNDDWQPLRHAVFTREGSLLDWSGMNEKPAGRQGWIVARGGHLEAESRPGEKLRLFGTNICDKANFLSKPDAQALARQLARQGYNAARLHHYDRHLVRPGHTLAAGWDEQKLDQLDYLFHCLKQEGLHVTIDLYTVRVVAAGEIEEVPRNVSLNEFKALVAISPSALANWKEFARRLLTHVNPYTGLAWKDDPALFSLCLLNEDNVLAHWNAAPDVETLYRSRFDGWQRRQALDEPRAQQWARFLLETHSRMTAACAAYVRGLGARTLITDANYRQDLPLALVRQDLDLVDNHNYHDLKHFLTGGWTLPYRFHQESSLANGAVMPRNLFVNRIFGKPYTVTEFNYCYPNHSRAEGGPLMGAYAALQDWDALFRYSYAHTPSRALSAQPVYYLDNASDPVNLLADRIVALLFRRGDVAAAQTRVPLLFSSGLLDSPDPLAPARATPPRQLEWLGFVHQVGLLPASGLPSWSGRAPFAPALAAPSPEPLVSETGEIRLESGAGRLTVVTPRTECFVASAAGELRGTVTQIRNHGGLAVVCFSSLDGQPLPHSKRILAIHLTDVQNRSATFRDSRHTILESWGDLPHLVRRGSADLRLRLEGGEATVRALELDGTPAHKLASRQAGPWLEFTASTVQPQGTFLVYEILRP